MNDSDFLQSLPGCAAHAARAPLPLQWHQGAPSKPTLTIAEPVMPRDPIATPVDCCMACQI
jgi:hypothetical protein